MNVPIKSFFPVAILTDEHQTLQLKSDKNSEQEPTPIENPHYSHKVTVRVQKQLGHIMWDVSFYHIIVL